ncbi:MAG: hypothetical protein AAF483_25350 [Planctomycetota bacterium]
MYEKEPMATIVRDDLQLQEYVLLGVGYGMAESALQSHGLLERPIRRESEAELVAVADRKGEIKWIPSIRLRVVSVDGKTCEELLYPSEPASE